MEYGDRLILDAMLTYGGSFLQALAEAAEKADSHNMERLKAAFPDYWAEYAELAQLSTREAP